MKEYKVVKWSLGLTGNNERLENTLNEYAKQGWNLKQLVANSNQIIFEKDKNQ